jgi:hypothetical protein
MIKKSNPPAGGRRHWLHGVKKAVTIDPRSSEQPIRASSGQLVCHMPVADGYLPHWTPTDPFVFGWSKISQTLIKSWVGRYSS